MIEWTVMSFVASSLSKIPTNLLAVFFPFEALGLCVAQGDVLLEYCLEDRITKPIYIEWYSKVFHGFSH